MKINYPKGETRCVSYYNYSHELVFVLTYKPTSGMYYLYEVLEDGELNKIGKGNNPNQLEEKYNVMEILQK